MKKLSTNDKGEVTLDGTCTIAKNLEGMKLRPELKDMSSEFKNLYNFGGSYDNIVGVGSGWGGISKASLESNGIDASNYPDNVIIYITTNITSWKNSGGMSTSANLPKGYYQLNTAPCSGSNYDPYGCNTNQGLALVSSNTQMLGCTYITESWHV